MKGIELIGLIALIIVSLSVSSSDVLDEVIWLQNPFLNISLLTPIQTTVNVTTNILTGNLTNHNQLSGLAWSASGHTIDTNLSMPNYWVNGNVNASRISSQWFCNATECSANLGGGGGGSTPDSSYMQYQFWNSTNTTYPAINATGWLNNLINSTIGSFFNLFANTIRAVTQIFTPMLNTTSISVQDINLTGVICNATNICKTPSQWAAEGGGGGGSSTNATYQSAWEFTTNRTYIPYFSDLNSSNLSYVTWVRWNITNESYVTYAKFNITNESYVAWAVWNATNASYDNLLRAAVLYSTWNSTNSSYLINNGWNAQANISSLSAVYINVTTLVAPNLMTYASWNSTNATYNAYPSYWNSSNLSYVTWARWNLTNESYVQWVYLNGSYMLYQYWNSTNSTYDNLLKTAILYSAWNSTNATYDAYKNSTGWFNGKFNGTIISFTKICNETECTTNVGGGGGGVAETDPVWTADKPSYLPYAYWNSTNTTYALNNTLSTMMWNTTNTSYALNTSLATVAWNRTNESYVTWAKWNITNSSYDNLLVTAVLYSTWNSTNISYMTWVMWNSTNSSYDNLLRTAMLYSTWNTTNASYLRNDIWNPQGNFTQINITSASILYLNVSTLIVPNLMTYAAWNATNASYALNTTFNSNPFNWKNTTENTSVVTHTQLAANYTNLSAWVDTVNLNMNATVPTNYLNAETDSVWIAAKGNFTTNDTTANYNTKTIANYTNLSAFITLVNNTVPTNYLNAETDPIWTAIKPSYMPYAYWNSTNASYISLNTTNWINNIINSTVGWFYSLYGNVITAVTQVIAPMGNFTSISANYINFSSTNYPMNQTNESYVSWAKFNVSNTTFSTVAWNQTNTTYALNTTLSKVAWNITNESYVQWVYMNISNSTFSKVAWNQTNTSYALNTTLSNVMWNTTNSSYGVINTTKWINNYGFNGTYVSTNNITIGNSGSSTIWNNGTWSFWL